MASASSPSKLATTAIWLVGLSQPGPEVPVATGAPEIGWILGRADWRRGYAFEAASACLAWAWTSLGVRDVVGYTSTINAPSRRLMEKLGMTRTAADDFEDTTVPVGDPLRPHVLYRIRNPAFRETADTRNAQALPGPPRSA